MTVMTSVTLTAVETVVDLIGAAIADTTNNALVSAAVNAIETWTPIIIEDAPELLSQFEQFIADLDGSDDLTDDQVTQMQTARTAIEARRAALNAGSAA